MCEKARELHRALAPLLPIKVSANATMSAAIVAGPRVIIVGSWNMTKSQLDQSLRARNLSPSQFQDRMQQQTQNAICSMKIIPAFVRLGGQVEYIYKTTDGYVFASPTVTFCQ